MLCECVTMNCLCISTWRGGRGGEGRGHKKKLSQSTIESHRNKYAISSAKLWLACTKVLTERTATNWPSENVVQGWVSVFYTLLLPLPPQWNHSRCEENKGLELCDVIARLDHIALLMQTLHQGQRGSTLRRAGGARSEGREHKVKVNVFFFF